MKYKKLLIIIIALMVIISCSKNSDNVNLSFVDEVKDVPIVGDVIADIVEKKDIEDSNNIDSPVIIGSSMYTYNSELGGYSVSASGMDNHLIIFPTINSIPVVAIADNAFYGMHELYGTLELPPTIKQIGNRAFEGCSSLKGDLYIPDSVEEIGDSAFENCCGFDGILYIGKGLKEINKKVFYNCNSLTGGIMVPKNITYIGSGAFFNCISLENTIYFTNSIVDIEADAFLEV